MTDAEWLLIAPNAMMILARALVMGVAPPLDGRPRRLTGIAHRLMRRGNDVTELKLLSSVRPALGTAQVWACGKEAADARAKLVQGRNVHGATMDTDAYGRSFAHCSTGGVDLNRTMVELGYAVAFRGGGA